MLRFFWIRVMSVVILAAPVLSTLIEPALAVTEGVVCSAITDTPSVPDIVVGQFLTPTVCFVGPTTAVATASVDLPIIVYLNSNNLTPTVLNTFIIQYHSSVTNVTVGGASFASGTQIVVTTAENFSRVVTYTFGGNNLTFTITKAAGTDTLGAFTVAAVPNTAPSITSNGGGATATINVAENQTGVTTVTASDPETDTVTFSITGGADSGKFSITSGGVLTFQAAPDFETPASNASSNAYVVEVTAADDGAGTLTDTQTITVTVTDVQAAQTISFINPGTQTFVSGGTVALTATGGGSGNAITLASTTTGICTVAGSTVTIVSAGTCSITADQVAGNDFAAAPQVTQSFTIGQGANTISFTGPANTALTSSPVTIAATSSSGLAVTFASTTASSGLTVSFASTTAPVCTVSGSTATFVSVGTCTITASQAGNANFVSAADVVRGFSISGDRVVTKSKAVIANTVSRRAGRILGGTPALSSRLGGGGSFGSSATGFGPLGLSGSGTLDNSKMCDWSISLRQVFGAGNASNQAHTPRAW